jgi:hypothetical protein
MAIIPLNQKFHTIENSVVTKERGSALVNAQKNIYTMQDIIDTAGGGLGGTQYVFVAADGTDVQNATELTAAYVTAQGMSPSATKRITIIAAPANYNFSAEFVMTTQYIDLVSLDGNMSIVFNGSATIRINANDVFVKGVDVLTKQFKIADNLNLLKLENCKGGSQSFAGIASGTFTNCIGGGSSFGFLKDASGVFTNCKAGQGSFGYAANASGIFNNCSSTEGDIFGYYGTANGTFNNCTASIFSFANQGLASGVFTNCVADFQSFGNGGATASLSGSLYYCRLIQGNFALVSGSGVTRLCIDGNNVINNQG